MLSVMTISAGLLSSCARDGARGPAGGNGPLDLPVNVTELQGSWRSNCSDAKLWGITQSTDLQVNGNAVTIVDRMSRNGRCSDNIVEVTYQGSYVRSGVEAGGIDLQPTSVRVKPLTDEGVRLLKVLHWCKIEDWAVGQERDVTEATRSGSEIEQRCFSKVPSTSYQIFAIDAGSLYFTRDTTAVSASKRPAQVDKDVVFTRL